MGKDRSATYVSTEFYYCSVFPHNVPGRVLLLFNAAYNNGMSVTDMGFPDWALRCSWTGQLCDRQFKS